MINWSVIYTYTNNCPPIHLEHLQKSNPTAQIILADISNDYPPKIAWQISDKFIREWLKHNIDKIQYSNVAIFEWDILVNKQLPNTPMGDNIFIGGIAKYPENKDWYWFRHTRKLPDYLQHYKIGCCPTGFIVCDLKALKGLIDNKFDSIYDSNIISELRLFSIFNYMGFQLIKYPSQTILHEPKDFNFSEKNIFHPVKTKVELHH